MLLNKFSNTENVNMSYLSRIQRKLRRVINSRLGDNSFDNRTVQKLLGFTKTGLRVVDNIQGLQMEYDYSSFIGNRLFFYGFFEEDEISFVFNKLSDKSAPVIFDIGSNIGLHTVRWSKVSSKAKVFAFEPSPETRDILERNISRNSLTERVVVVPQAVSDKSGHETFFCCDDDAYSSLKDTKRKKVINSLQVQTTTVDKFVETHLLEKISLIKIDVEGFEREVIAGAVNTLKDLKPDLFVEIYSGSNSNPDPEATVRLICSFGYKAYVLVNGGLMPFEKHSDSNYNYYFSC
jgi:FkbM family methyltransferase